MEIEEKKSARIPLKAIIFVFIFCQLVVIYGLFYKKNSVAVDNKLITMWQKMAKKLWHQGNYKQATHFYEKILREIAPDHPLYKKTRDELQAIYVMDSKKKKAKKITSKSINNLPKLYNLAEMEYHQGNYEKAQQYYYEFLAQKDLSKQYQKLAPQVYFRINQCDLLLNLTLPPELDQVSKKALELIKN